MKFLGYYDLLPPTKRQQIDDYIIRVPLPRGGTQNMRFAAGLVGGGEGCIITEQTFLWQFIKEHRPNTVIPAEILRHAQNNVQAIPANNPLPLLMRITRPNAPGANGMFIARIAMSLDLLLLVALANDALEIEEHDEGLEEESDQDNAHAVSVSADNNAVTTEETEAINIGNSEKELEEDKHELSSPIETSAVTPEVEEVVELLSIPATPFPSFFWQPSVGLQSTAYAEKIKQFTCKAPFTCMWQKPRDPDDMGGSFALADAKNSKRLVS